MTKLNHTCNVEIVFEDKNKLTFPVELLLDEGFLSALLGKTEKSAELIQICKKYFQALQNIPEAEIHKRFNNLVKNSPEFKNALHKLTLIEKEKILKDLGIAQDNTHKALYAEIVPFKYNGGQKIEIDKPPKEEEE